MNKQLQDIRTKRDKKQREKTTKVNPKEKAVLQMNADEKAVAGKQKALGGSTVQRGTTLGAPRDKASASEKSPEEVRTNLDGIKKRRRNDQTAAFVQSVRSAW